MEKEKAKEWARIDTELSILTRMKNTLSDDAERLIKHQKAEQLKIYEVIVRELRESNIPNDKIVYILKLINDCDKIAMQIQKTRDAINVFVEISDVDLFKLKNYQNKRINEQ